MTDNTEQTNNVAAASLADSLSQLIESAHKKDMTSIDVPLDILRKLVNEYREALAYMPPEDALNFSVEAEQHNGVRIPMRVILHYPENHGIYAIEVLKALPQYSRDVLKDMIAKNDMSVLTALANQAEQQRAEQNDDESAETGAGQ